MERAKYTGEQSDERPYLIKWVKEGLVAIVGENEECESEYEDYDEDVLGAGVVRLIEQGYNLKHIIPLNDSGGATTGLLVIVDKK